MDDTYQDVNDPAITVKFDITEGFHKRFNLEKWGNPKCYILAWTTTPWTIPANMALAFNKKIPYSLVHYQNEIFVVAKNRVESVFEVI
jgi:isoleucyl-tRNA synthetase